MHHLIFRTLLATTIGLLGVSHSLAADGNPSTGRRPNILLIVSDDQGYADLGCYDGKEIKTPRLDALARQGVRCTSFYVSWPACTPSRGSILTGRYPQRNGLYEMIRNDITDLGYKFTETDYPYSAERVLGMDVREITIAQVMKQAGYHTGVIGKWDGGQLKRYLPLQRGFDFYFGFPNTGIDYFTHERYGYPCLYRGNERIKMEGYSTELFKNEAIQFIEQNKAEPFFLYLPFNAPHGASSLTDREAQVPADYLKKTYPDSKASESRRKYMGCVSYMDDCIGQILDKLDALNLADDTLVVFFSDNGGGGGADNHPLKGKKQWLHEGGIRVPMIARLPGRIPPGTTSDAFLASLDLFPTFTRFVGQSLPSGVTYDGFDIMPVLANGAESPRKQMCWERRGDQAARVGNIKWVQSSYGNGLFDLSKDVSEKHDLSQEKPDLLKEMQGHFAKWRAEMDAAEPRGPFRDY